jgi:hypothetical protein
MVTVEVITYIATSLLGVVELRVAEKRLITAVARLTTTIAKLLFIVLSRALWTFLPLRSFNAMVGLRSSRGSRWQCHYHDRWE